MKTQWVDLFPKRILILHSERMISDLLSFGLKNEGYIVNTDIRSSTESVVPLCDLLLLESVVRKDKQAEVESVWRSVGSPPIIEIIRNSDYSRTVDVFTDSVKCQIHAPIDILELIQKIKVSMIQNADTTPNLQVSSTTNAYQIKGVKVYLDRFEFERGNTVISLGKIELYIFIQLLQHEFRYLPLIDLQYICMSELQIGRRTIQEYIFKLRRKLAVFQGEVEIRNLRNRGYRLIIRNQGEQS